MAQINTIAIIGAGFSGTMLAVQLLRQAQQPLKLYLIEAKPGQLGRGVAYSSNQDCHLLNVPASNMSAFPDQPTHFFAWAKAREGQWQQSAWLQDITPETFLPRRIYGDYLRDVLDKTEQATFTQHQLHRISDKVVSLSEGHGQVELGLSGGWTFQAQKVVLAIGNFPPGDQQVETPDFYQSGRYFSNPWSSELLPALLETSSCLLIGTGLTMVDCAVALKAAGYQGQIHSISRRGLSPQAHRLSLRKPPSIKFDKTPKIRSLLHQVRELSAETNYDWRIAIDALRPISQTLWVSLPLAEQKRFLRHLRTYWDSHRHRLPPSIAEQLEALRRSGQLRQHVGRILAYQESVEGVEVSFRQRGYGDIQTINVEAVVNCSGSESNYRKLDCPLVKDLLKQGLALPDALQLGLDVSEDGALLDAQGKVSSQLFSLGPPQKGHYWETTAVPEIRGQAEMLARYILFSSNLYCKNGQ